MEKRHTLIEYKIRFRLEFNGKIVKNTESFYYFSDDDYNQSTAKYNESVCIM